MENYRQIKRVSFKGVEKDLEKEVIEKVKELISIKVSKVREEWNRKFKELEEKVTKIEKEIEEGRKEGKERRNMEDGMTGEVARK